MSGNLRDGGWIRFNDHWISVLLTALHHACVLQAWGCSASKSGSPTFPEKPLGCFAEKATIDRNDDSIVFWYTKKIHQFRWYDILKSTVYDIMIIQVYIYILYTNIHNLNEVFHNKSAKFEIDSSHIFCWFVPMPIPFSSQVCGVTIYAVIFSLIPLPAVLMCFGPCGLDLGWWNQQRVHTPENLASQNDISSSNRQFSGAMFVLGPVNLK